ncbi:MAG: LURP-one-related family protein [Lachnospiraceae bacterium]|nr:LURP-one-related family protein [Lachnospiraceae bacterium]
MQLRIKQRVFSWADKFDIYDENDQVKYTVQGEFFSFGRRLHIYDTYGEEVGLVRQKVWSFLPKFYIERGGESIGLISKAFTWWKPKYEIDYLGWRCEGNWTGWDYYIDDANGSLIATIKKELFHWGDTYVITYDLPEDELPILMLVLAIDAATADAAAAAAASGS